MRQLLAIEWMKLKSYRTFWILSGLYLFSILGLNLIAFRVQQSIYEAKEAQGMAEMVLGSTPYSFPTTWQMTSFMSSFLLFIPGLIMVIQLTNEFSYRTHRQNIIDGWNRREFITVKIMLAMIMSAISTLMVIVTATIFGFADGNRSFSVENFQYIPYAFLQAFSYSMVALLIAVLVKRGGLAIGIYFMYSVIIEDVVKLLLNMHGGSAGRYLPLQSSDELIRLPLLQNAQDKFWAPANPVIMLIVALTYLAAYIFFVIRKFETDDL
ncbi:ABC transporter permease [Paraflavitalea sp. CAU 1676]|uniref:ABC transporter permease n=1 Tax=Paraflavitalea sp. CAU 1676 TaxID=3032598 RepID=UPI0023DBDF2A|nr:ABC transporter permease [Paraflavitalea sp. CAU 1676]MDF2187646.1 ABC transporter permease [Paraflavitalea sp. CAU 1676]